ncbi:aminotransferase class I/II-fold pyridoxal phosphate-dependent enzyme [Flavobacteriaceae bacterium LMO-SS05]
MIKNYLFEISLATSSDREKIYQLRHEVYGTELMQHSENDSGIYRDQLDDFNTYICAKINAEIVGFISVTPPLKNIYSIDKYFKRKELPFKVDDRLYEMRILTVLKAHRGKPIALMLMMSAFRWIQSNGGTNIMAIGRIEVLNMYIKLGFSALNKTIKAGNVTFELLYGNVESINTLFEYRFKKLFIKLQKQCQWNLDIAFFKPTDCYHGGAFFDAIGNEFDNLDRRKTIINADVLDAWFDPSPKVIEALKTHLPWICKTSPPTDCSGMAISIANLRGVKVENILPGAGSSDLIFMAFREWLTTTSRVLILDPTYGEYVHVLQNIIGCQVDRIDLLKANNYVADTDTLIAQANNNYDLIIIVNPNSPTGQHISRTKLETILNQIPISTRIWIDETYIEYTGNDQSLELFATRSKNNIIICKSMSKVYALSGLRAAYLCASPYQLEKLKSISPPWAVSLPAQIAAVTALEDREYYETCYKQTHTFREEFTKELSKFNSIEVVPSIANFILCHLPSHGPNAETVVSSCKAKGLYLRDVSNMGTNFDKFTIRIAIKDRDTNQMILKLLEKALIE